MTDFQLHPRLEQDCFVVGDLALCQLLLMNDSQYPWFILVPRRAELTEIYQLSLDERPLLLAESCLLAENLQTIYQADKLNIATIGNLVPQLHMHHVVRYRNDIAWPAPVWGKAPALPYAQHLADMHIKRIREALSINFLNKSA
jgi:diadenosine tetraphosphate (Ap4A) HIT family hydrolase